MLKFKFFNHKLVKLQWSLSLSLLILFQPVQLAWSADAVRERTLVIGKVSANPKKHYRYLKPMADYVVKQMNDLGIDKVEVLMARDNRQMIRYLKKGKVDWVTETVFSAVEFENKAGAEIILLKWKKGVPTYYTVFFTRKGSAINGLEDLKGKVITLQDKGSSSGFFIPVAMMLDAGLELVELASPRQKPPKNKVGYVLGKEEINMAAWVHKGVVDAGAYANLDWITEDHTPLGFRDNMRIFDQSQSFPRALELVRKGIRPEVKQRLKSVLLAAADDPDAAPVLDAYQKTRRFDELDKNVFDGINRARKIMETLNQEPGF